MNNYIPLFEIKYYDKQNKKVVTELVFFFAQSTERYYFKRRKTNEVIGVEFADWYEVKEI